MIQNSVSESNCQYLFGKEANEIFKNTTLSKIHGIDKSKFIEDCLELSLRVHIYLFTNHEGILLLDPRAFNKQCQLYALRAVQINRNYHQKTEEEKRAKTEENRFLHLGFFINYAFRDLDNYMRTVLSTLKKMNITLNSQEVPRKHFITFLRDEDRSRERASRIAFNQVFESYMKRTLDHLQGRDPLQQELSLLSHEDLQIDGTSLGVKVGKLYTYPKLSGLAYMLDAVARENIPIVLQVKVLNKDGSGGVIRYSNEQFDKNASVIVFGGFATDGSYSVQHAMEEAKKCSTYLYRHSDPKKRHSSETTCFYCKPIEMDLKPHLERLKKVMSSVKNLLFTLGSEFILQEQKPFVKFFKNPEKYPQLKDLFDHSLEKVNELDLETNHLRTFAIYHTYTESGKSALSDDFALDLSPRDLLIKKEMIVTPPKKASLLEDFLKEKGITQLPRSERKRVISTFGDFLNQKGFNIKSRRERFPKEQIKLKRQLKKQGKSP